MTGTLGSSSHDYFGLCCMAVWVRMVSVMCAGAVDNTYHVHFRWNGSDSKCRCASLEGILTPCGGVRLEAILNIISVVCKAYVLCVCKVRGHT